MVLWPNLSQLDMSLGVGIGCHTVTSAMIDGWIQQAHSCCHGLQLSSQGAMLKYDDI